ncbi:hypothetical protein [Legionella micdadei]|nr:hypothetical protein [Legionella micdadei]NSL18012.1 hypothetical protein [Legionella micdadei]
MNKIVYILFIFLPGLLFAQGCIIGNKPDRPRYVCFDGRTLATSQSGFVWNAKRGCFMSSIPCCAYNATHYSYSENPQYVYHSFKRCRYQYPFQLGEMQTH